MASDYYDIETPFPYICNLKTHDFFSSLSVTSCNQLFNNSVVLGSLPIVLKHITSYVCVIL